MDWYLMKENGDTFWTQCESREQALAAVSYTHLTLPTSHNV